MNSGAARQSCGPADTNCAERRNDVTGPYFGAATLAIKPGTTDPVVVAGTHERATTRGCRVCHAVSLNGSTLFTQHGDSASYSCRRAVRADDGQRARRRVTPASERRLSGALARRHVVHVELGTIDVATPRRSAYASTARCPIGAAGASATPAGPRSAAASRPSRPTASTSRSTTSRRPAAPTTADGKSLAVLGLRSDQQGVQQLRQAAHADHAASAAWSSFLPTNDASCSSTRSRRLATAPARLHALQRHAASCGGSTSRRRRRARSTRSTAQRGRHHELPADERQPPRRHEAQLRADGEPGRLGRLRVGRVHQPPPLRQRRDASTPWHERSAQLRLRRRRSDGARRPKKLWVAAIDLNAPAGTDPRHPAFYLPAQELLAGNARGFWVVDPVPARRHRLRDRRRVLRRLLPPRRRRRRAHLHQPAAELLGGVREVHDDRRLLRRRRRASPASTASARSRSRSRSPLLFSGRRGCSSRRSG